MLLKERVAIVTGGGKAIGRAIALAFAREGADVVVAARTEVDLNESVNMIKQAGGRALAVVTDLAVPALIEKMVTKAIKEFGKIDILVNNSGLEGPKVGVADMNLDEWNETLAVNMTGAMLCCKHVLNQSMLPRKSGSIINITSTSGRQGVPMRSPYSATKFGLIGLSQSLASEVGKDNIRVNCIAPGPVEGDRLVRVLQAHSKNFNLTYDETVKMLCSRTILGRMIKPTEVAELAVFLASDSSSAITGQTINCDAGFVMN